MEVRLPQSGPPYGNSMRPDISVLRAEDGAIIIHCNGCGLNEAPVALNPAGWALQGVAKENLVVDRDSAGTPTQERWRIDVERTVLTLRQRTWSWHRHGPLAYQNDELASIWLVTEPTNVIATRMRWEE